MKILVTDGLANEAVELLKNAGHKVVLDEASAERLLTIIGEYDALCVRSRTKVKQDVLDKAANLKVIGRAGIGVDNIDIAYARKNGIKVVNAPTGSTVSVAELAIGHMLALARGIVRGTESIKRGEWIKKQLKGTELSGKTIGIIGCGRIGREVAKRAFAFDMKVIGCDPYIQKDAATRASIRLSNLEEILKQSEGKGIYVYSHGEMLPCHGYQGLKKYSHFYGHYGTAWQNQTKEFADFPGAILMTTNCIQRPKESYQSNIFTTGLVGFPGVTHIDNYDFTPVIKKALEMPGFPEDTNGRSVMCGFGHNTVLGIAGTVIDAVKSKAIRHFFLVGGCDGAKPGRSYYKEFVEKVPKDCVVLTLACGKFRFFDKDLGTIGGIPRLLDIGQCNDAYSAIQIAIALAKAFNVGVNDLPLSMILSWYEQKAVAILLTLLYLGINDIRLGPSLPAFITPNVLDVLVKTFNIKPISTPDEDLKAILGG
jgi:hydroxylamine reductase